MKRLSSILLITLALIFIQISYTQWVKQSIPIDKPIVGIEFKDSLNGWSCTSRGASNFRSYIMHTTNGGTNWLIQHDSADYNFYAMDMVTDSVGYVVGSSLANSNGLVLKTTNAGLSWINLNISVGLIIEDIFFPSKDSGYICSSNSFGPGLWFTSNGGLNWVTRMSGVPADVRTLFFLNNNTGWCGESQSVYKTTNAGQNWVNNGNFTKAIHSIYFINNTEGWLGASSDEIYRTVNGGLNWTTTSLPPLFGTITDLYFFNALYGYGGNRSLRILKTTNAGVNWGYQIDSSASYKISFIDSNKGWSGDFGIAKTTNGGGSIIYMGITNLSNEIPSSFSLYQNYPNPFNPITFIKYQIKTNGFVLIKVFDLLGREIVTLVNQNQNAGTYLVDWSAEAISSGTYFYRLIVNGDIIDTKKMIFLK